MAVEPRSKRSTRASGVRSMRGSRSSVRSTTTRATGSGNGLNWATRTRSTPPPVTGIAERLARLTTPSRSTTKRGGSLRRKVE